MTLTLELFTDLEHVSENSYAQPWRNVRASEIDGAEALLSAGYVERRGAGYSERLIITDAGLDALREARGE